MKTENEKVEEQRKCFENVRNTPIKKLFSGNSSFLFFNRKLVQAWTRVDQNEMFTLRPNHFHTNAARKFHANTYRRSDAFPVSFFIANINYCAKTSTKCFRFCCCIPYYFSCCKNIHHYCPSCGQYLETFRR